MKVEKDQECSSKVHVKVMHIIINVNYKHVHTKLRDGSLYFTGYSALPKKAYQGMEIFNIHCTGVEKSADFLLGY